MFSEVRQAILPLALRKMQRRGDLERAGLLKARWRDSDAGRSRKYYSLTAAGRRRADSKRRQWTSLSAAMKAILGTPRG